MFVGPFGWNSDLANSTPPWDEESGSEHLTSITGASGVEAVIILNTISKRQDGSDLFRILHTKSFSRFTEASVYYVIPHSVSRGITSPFLA